MAFGFGQFLQGGLGQIGGQLFPVDPGMSMPRDPGMSVPGQPSGAPTIDPAYAQAAQRNALITLGLGLMAARDDRQGLGHGLLSAYQGAQSGYQGAMDNAFRNTLLKREADYRQQDRDRQAKLQQQQDRQAAAATAGRVVTGMQTNATNPGAYWDLVSKSPDVQDALKQLGIQAPYTGPMADPAQLQAFQQQLQTAAQLGAPVSRPVEVAAGASLVDPMTGKAVFTAPKDTSITPYQQAQLEIERQRLAQQGKGNAIQVAQLAGKLRDDYTQTVKNTGWFDQQGFYERLKSVSNDRTGASDLALVFSYMKVLDPTSAVREGEYANAQNTAGIPGKIIAQYNKVLDGAFLSPTQREEFIKSADKIYGSAFKRQEAIRKDFTSKAERQGINPQDVLVDYGAPAPVSATGGWSITPVQ